MKKEKVIKVRLIDYPLVKSRKTKEPTLDEIGEYVNDVLNEQVIYYGKRKKQTRKDVRTIAEYKFGKIVVNKYTDEALEDAWFQYEPQ